ncbi:hypothetical protein AVDCRST_MAG82-221, partial [uncultured Rubrobacteraceae bacterium]
GRHGTDVFHDPDVPPRRGGREDPRLRKPRPLPGLQAGHSVSRAVQAGAARLRDTAILGYLARERGQVHRVGEGLRRAARPRLPLLAHALRDTGAPPEPVDPPRAGGLHRAERPLGQPGLHQRLRLAPALAPDGADHDQRRGTRGGKALFEPFLDNRGHSARQRLGLLRQKEKRRSRLSDQGRVHDVEVRRRRRGCGLALGLAGVRVSRDPGPGRLGRAARALPLVRRVPLHAAGGGGFLHARPRSDGRWGTRDFLRRRGEPRLLQLRRELHRGRYGRRPRLRQRARGPAYGGRGRDRTAATRRLRDGRAAYAGARAGALRGVHGAAHGTSASARPQDRTPWPIV